ncbi:E3 ubiquitin ligase RBR family [Trema orientale]|uniref:RBR-type E3 ubiquitin transferase n=1 Tax=Trema orientale TaxID=63057 RepID=A0A2P5DYG6_TREOI|nr:E3 ubiquitin ligase RBR family [Trema orientale]
MLRDGQKKAEMSKDKTQAKSSHWEIGRGWKKLLSLFGIRKDKKATLGERLRSKEKEPKKLEDKIEKSLTSLRENFTDKKEPEKSKEENIDQSPLTSISCKICMEEKTEEEMFMSNNCAHHSYCLVCISSHVAAKLEQHVSKLKCPEVGCNTYLEPLTCKSFLPRQVLKKWEVALCKSFTGSRRISCPFKDCSATLLVHNGREEALTSEACPRCHRLICVQCRVPWHAGSTCQDKMVIKLAGKKGWKRCPNCGFYVQKISGCRVVRCS